MRECRICGICKPLEDYQPDLRARGGYKTACKTCTRSYLNQRNRIKRDEAEIIAAAKHGFAGRSIYVTEAATRLIRSNGAIARRLLAVTAELYGQDFDDLARRRGWQKTPTIDDLLG